MKKKKTTFQFLSKAIKVFAVSVGVTAITMLSSVGWIGSQNSNTNPAREASLFNLGANPQYSAAEVPVDSSISGKTYVIPLGTSFGIKLFTDGVIVTALSEIQSGDRLICPAQIAGIRTGDYILSVNDVTIDGNADLAGLIGQSAGNPIKLTVRRGEEVFETTVTPVFSEDSFKTGMWVRDSAAGIGTLTFYNPENGVFAGLGHGICDMDTNGLMALGHGEPADIKLSGIIRGKPDEPGQLRGYFSSGESLGQLLANNETGVYGRFFEPPTGDPVEIASRKEIKTGPAEILASVDESGPKQYQAVIQKIQSADQRTKNFVIQVTDPILLSLTGGIVQGMSGCPILQNGKLVGAVTHVFTDDPKTGYGIFADTMVKESVTFSMSK